MLISTINMHLGLPANGVFILVSELYDAQEGKRRKGVQIMAISTINTGPRLLENGMFVLVSELYDGQEGKGKDVKIMLITNSTHLG